MLSYFLIKKLHIGSFVFMLRLIEIEKVIPPYVIELMNLVHVGLRMYFLL